MRWKRIVEGSLAVALMVAGVWLRYRIREGWLFAGSDSYGYLSIADELWNHHRYSLAAGEPPHIGRMPLYSIFLALVKRAHVANVSGGEGWIDVVAAQMWLDVATLPFVYWMGRRLGGAGAGLLALAFAALWPLSLLYDFAVLSESLACSLTTLTVAALVLGAGRPRRWFTVAGAGVGLSVLARPDGALLALGFIPALLCLRASWRERARVGLLALAACLLVYAPWPLRNLAQTGHPYWFGARVDRRSRPLRDYQGYWRWIQSWSEDHTAQCYLSTCFYNQDCYVTTGLYPPSAFESPDEQQKIVKLMDRRNKEGPTAAIQYELYKLALKKEARHPFRVRVLLPLERARHMWISPFDELLQNKASLWKYIREDYAPHIEQLMKYLVEAFLLGGLLLLLYRNARAGALILLIIVVGRTLILCYANYSMPRYTVEVIPLVFVVIGAAVGSAARSLGAGAWAAVRWLRTRRRERD